MIFCLSIDRGKPWKLNVSSSNIKNRKSDEQNSYGLLNTEIGKPKTLLHYIYENLYCLTSRLGIFHSMETHHCSEGLQNVVLC